MRAFDLPPAASRSRTSRLGCSRSPTSAPTRAARSRRERSTTVGDRRVRVPRQRLRRGDRRADRRSGAGSRGRPPGAPGGRLGRGRGRAGRLDLRLARRRACGGRLGLPARGGFPDRRPPGSISRRTSCRRRGSTSCPRSRRPGCSRCRRCIPERTSPSPRPAGAAVPRGADPPEVSTEPWIDIPGEVLDVYRLVETLAAAARGASGAGAPDARASTTSTRASRRRAATSPTPRSPRSTTTRRRTRSAGHRDRRRPVGLRPRDGLEVLRPRLPGLHGEGLVRAEAVPADLHGDVRRRGRPLAVPTTQAGKAILEADPTRRDRSGSRSARRSRSPPPPAARSSTRSARS